jgi:hypothetical protein
MAILGTSPVVQANTFSGNGGATTLSEGVFPVVSYLRLVVGLRFVALEAAGSQLVYLVLFSWAHFFEGFTGLIVTVGSILTLFFLMQMTGRIRWSEKFGPSGQAEGPAATLRV